MLGVVRVINWPAAVELRNSRIPLVALASLLVLTVAPVPTGDMLSTSQTVAAARTALVDATKANSANSKRREKMARPGFVFIWAGIAMLMRNAGNQEPGKL